MKILAIDKTDKMVQVRMPNGLVIWLPFAMLKQYGCKNPAKLVVGTILA